jgi:ABC-type sulfate transport system permease subunit
MNRSLGSQKTNDNKEIGARGLNKYILVSIQNIKFNHAYTVITENAARACD